MVGVLGTEGWLCHPLLPQDWRVRPSTTKAVRFLTGEGLVLGLSRALAHLDERPQEYGQEVRPNITQVARGISAVREEEKVTTGWQKSETFLPPGWLVRQGRGKKGATSSEFLLSPQGVQVRGRLGAIQLLLREGREKEDEEVLSLREGLQLQGWQEDEQLPNGWLRRTSKVMRSGKWAGDQFLSPGYREICGLERVYHHLRVKSCSPSILVRLRDQLSIKGILSNRKCNTKKKERWREGPDLPPGWRTSVRKFKYGKKSREFFLSPSGIQLPQAVLAFQLMVEEGVYRREELEALLPRLEREGWQEDASLPEGWRIHLDPSAVPGLVEGEVAQAGDPEVLFLARSPATCRILGFSAAMVVLQEQEGYTRENVAGFRNLVRYLKSDLSEPDWCSDDNLPNNWQLRREDLGFKVQVHIKSAHGEEFSSVLEAFSVMAGNRRKHSSQEIEGMMRLLVLEEGWETNSLLPEGWMLVRDRGDLLFQVRIMSLSLFLQILTIALTPLLLKKVLNLREG